jgi:hypothetical protein
MPSKIEAWISIVAISLMVSPAALCLSGRANAQVASIEWTGEPPAKFRATQEHTTEVTLDNFRALLIEEGRLIKSELQVGDLACEVRGNDTQACLVKLRLEPQDATSCCSAKGPRERSRQHCCSFPIRLRARAGRAQSWPSSTMS